jgi:hypothetical protein
MRQLEGRLSSLENVCSESHEANSALRHEIAVLESEMTLLRAQEASKVATEKALRAQAECSQRKAEDERDALLKEYVAYKVNSANDSLELEKSLHAHAKTACSQKNIMQTSSSSSSSSSSLGHSTHSEPSIQRRNNLKVGSILSRFVGRSHS